MCWQVAIPLLTSAAGMAMQGQAERDAQNKQNRELAEGIARQNAFTQEASARVADDVRKVATSTPEQDTMKARTQFMDALRKATPANSATFNPGAASNRFASDVGASNADAAAETGALVDRTSRIEAPMFQRLREGNQAANTVSDLSLIAGRSGGQDYLTRLRASLIRPNPWMQAGGSLLTGVGSGMATNGGWGSDEIKPVKPRKRA